MITSWYQYRWCSWSKASLQISTQQFLNRVCFAVCRPPCKEGSSIPLSMAGCPGAMLSRKLMITAKSSDIETGWHLPCLKAAAVSAFKPYITIDASSKISVFSFRPFAATFGVDVRENLAIVKQVRLVCISGRAGKPSFPK